MQPRNPCADELNVGDLSPELVVEEVTRTQIVRYAGASGDFNPIHHDEVFARSAGLDGIFAIGMMTAGFLSHLVSDWLGLQNVRSYKVRFRDRVWPGDRLVCQGRIVAKTPVSGGARVEAELVVRNQHGKSVIGGTAVADLVFTSRVASIGKGAAACHLP